MLVRLQVDTQTPQELHTTFGMLGEYTKTQFGLACNAFAGESACVSIDHGNSDIARFCNMDQAQIDCMFYSQDMMDMRQVEGLGVLRELRVRGRLGNTHTHTHHTPHSTTDPCGPLSKHAHPWSTCGTALCMPRVFDQPASPLVCTGRHVRAHNTPTSNTPAYEWWHWSGGIWVHVQRHSTRPPPTYGFNPHPVPTLGCTTMRNV